MSDPTRTNEEQPELEDAADANGAGTEESQEPEAELIEEEPVWGESDGEDVDPEVALEAELEETQLRLQRAQADYQNLKRRTQTDVENRMRRTMEPLLRNLLLVLDHLEMALMSPTESQDAKNLAIGVEMVRKQMLTALEESEVEPIAESGAFNPDLHQAIAEVPSDEHEAGAIVETVRRGYTWRGKALRHGEVRVAAAGQDAAEGDEG